MLFLTIRQKEIQLHVKSPKERSGEGSAWENQKLAMALMAAAENRFIQFASFDYISHENNYYKHFIWFRLAIRQRNEITHVYKWTHEYLGRIFI